MLDIGRAKTKRDMSAEIQKHIEAYEAAGGKIEALPSYQRQDQDFRSDAWHFMQIHYGIDG